MRGISTVWLSLILLALSETSAARVFDFSKEKAAAYFRGTAGLSDVQQEAFIHSSGTQSDIDGKVEYNLSGELGFVFGFMGNMNIRLGAEALQTKSLQTKGNLTGTSQELFTLDSDVFIFNPNLTIELVIGQRDIFRGYVYGGVGWAMVTLDNKYTMTTLGTTTYTGVSSYTEKSETERFSGHAGAGFEVLMADTTTFSLDVGYRYLPIERLKYKADVVAINGNKVKGTEVVNSGAGDFRQFDMSGAYIGATFRFYIGAL